MSKKLDAQSLELLWAKFKDYNSDILTANPGELNTSSGTVVEAINELRSLIIATYGNYCLSSWDTTSTSPTATQTLGDVDFALAWYPFLIDHTAPETSDGKKPGKRLKSNNWFRDINGNFSPAVTVSQSDYNAVDGVDLYKKVNNELVKFSDAVSEFDHVAYYNENGVEPLFDSLGNEVHVRKPWETTSTDYSILIGRTDTIHVVDNNIGTSGLKFRGILGHNKTKWDGFNVSSYSLPPTGFAPSPSGTISGKTRNFFITNSGIGDSNSRGESGIGGLISYYKNDGLYPRSQDATQITNMNWARANNSNSEAPFPFAEGGYHALNAFLCSMEAAYGTKYLHSPEMFSSGTSSNDNCNSETTWKSNGGVKYRLVGSDSWSYAKLSDTTPFYYNTSEKRSSWSETLNYRKGIWRVGEAQVVASYISELEISADTEFEFMGKTYYRQNPEGVKTIEQGEMNARIYRIDDLGEVSAYDVDGNGVTYEVQVILRCGLMSGINASGDVNAYIGGGYELIGNNTTNVLYPYIQPDQKKWARLTAVNTVDIGEEYGIEGSYIPLPAITETLTNGYVESQDPFVPIYNSGGKGGSISTGECHYAYMQKSWTAAGKMVRVGLRFRGSAATTACSPRYVYSIYAVSIASRTYGCSAQCLLDTKS